MQGVRSTERSVQSSELLHHLTRSVQLSGGAPIHESSPLDSKHTQSKEESMQALRTLLLDCTAEAADSGEADVAEQLEQRRASGAAAGPSTPARSHRMRAPAQASSARPTHRPASGPAQADSPEVKGRSVLPRSREALLDPHWDTQAAQSEEQQQLFTQMQLVPLQQLQSAHSLANDFLEQRLHTHPPVASANKENGQLVAPAAVTAAAADVRRKSNSRLSGAALTNAISDCHSLVELSRVYACHAEDMDAIHIVAMLSKVGHFFPRSLM